MRVMGGSALIALTTRVVKEPSPLQTVLLVVIDAIVEVFLLCMVGFMFARRGILDDKTKKILNKLNVSLFTPALLFSKVAFSLSPDKLADLVIIPVGFVICTIVSGAVAFGLAVMFRLTKSQRNFSIACAAFQNSNSLPIALCQSLIGERLPLKWYPGDTRDHELGRALSYLVLFSTLGIIVRWSVGVKLMTSTEAMPAAEEEEEAHAADDHDEREPLISHGTTPSTATSVTVKPLQTPNGSVRFHANDERHRRPRSIFQSFPNTPVPSSRATSAYGSEDEDDFGTVRRVQDGPASRAGERWQTFKARVRKAMKPVKRGWKRLNDFMTVPLWAALLSLVVACIPPLQHGLDQLEPVKASIRSAGNCSVPITLVTLGAYFYSPPAPKEDDLPPTPPTRSHETMWGRLKGWVRSQRGKKHTGETRTVIVAVLSRMIITPLLLLPLFAFYAVETANVADDPVFVLVACLLIGSPTAITLAQISSSAAGRTFEKLISRTLFVSYAILTAPTTIALVMAALFIDRLQREA